MTQSFTNFTCWNVGRVPEVINREAVEMASAAFMATHMPITGLRYEIGEYAVEDSSELGLLNILTQRSESNLHSFIVLKGAPGAGKSHLIRWLKERFEIYQQENGHQEAVLLIRRANSSLRSTINQIIEAKVFDAPIFNSYAQRLREASTRLTGEEMLNRILNGLQEAALAVRQESYQLPSGKHFPRRITENMPEFLQNQTVRTELARSGASLGRIAVFLTGEGRTTRDGEEMPQFNADDFEFPLKAITNIRMSPYEEVQNLAGFLTTQRDTVSEYLNSLLNRAVANLTSLTTEQLRDMFGELRRQLRREGKNLTLFIEDITAFTGLDVALLDVLIAQHGAENPEYCRLTSVVGVTDHYYDAYFQDNIRQRLTFLISMNAIDQNEQVSQLLQSPAAVSEMASRYLNAIRLGRDELEDWNTAGAAPEALPIACNLCPVRETCHSTFGVVRIGADSNTDVGLYPFNQRALWNLYSNLDVSVVGRTPRSLINNILAYMLVSHTDRIKRGQFPSPTMELVDNVSPPLLRKVAQRLLIDQQAANRQESERIESLVRIWGNGTIDTVDYGDKVTIGDLPEAAFKVFGMTAVRGDVLAPPVVGPDSAPGTEPPNPPIDTTGPSPNAEDIQQWLEGGRLLAYRELAQELVGFIKSAIEWDLYGISRTLVEERITQARMEIEGQDAVARQRPRYFIRRSKGFAIVLNALDELYAPGQLPVDQITTDIALLHDWLDTERTSLIEYVIGSGAELSEAPINYATLVIESACALAALAGAMVPSETTPREWYLRLVAFAKRSDSMVLESASDGVRSEQWQRTMKGLKDADKLHDEFLKLLNCPQGSAVGFVYLDASRAIRVLSAFRGLNLYPALIVFPETKSPAWGIVQGIHQRLAQHMRSAFTAERESLDVLIHAIDDTCGRTSIEDTFRALEQFVKFAETARFEFPLPDDLSAKKLTNRLLEIEKVIEIEHGSLEEVLRLSGILKHKRELARYVEYFTQLTTSLDRSALRIRDELASRDSENVLVRKDKILSALRVFQGEAQQLAEGDAS